jgi:hypothetical protein
MSGQIKTPGGPRPPAPLPTSCPCGLTHDDEDPARKFYVSVVDGERFNFLAGPFDTHAEALAQVEPTRSRAEEVDPRACWYSFGTARAPAGYTAPGLLDAAYPKKQVA